MSEALQPPDRLELKESQLEKAREHVDLRFRFAEAVSKAKGVPISDALRDYTDLFVRGLGTWPGESRDCDDIWTAYVERINSMPDRNKQINETISFFQAHIPKQKEHTQDAHWPFRYDYSEETKSIVMHFGSMNFEPDQAQGEPGILSRERLHEQRAKLKAMFAEIKRKHPDAEWVKGSSWLYNRESYRRLFPRAYTESHTIRQGRFQGGGTWGQFRQKDGGVNAELRQQFLKNIEHLDAEKLYEAFPLKTWVVGAPIQEFYKEYGIE